MENRIKLNSLYSPTNSLIKVKRGVSIILKGQKPDGIYIIKKGLVKIEREVFSEGNFTTEVCGSEDILGLSEIMNNEDYNFTATCLTSCELYFVSRKDFYESISISPEIYIDLMRYLCNRIENLENEILVQSGYNLHDKINRLMLILARKYSKSDKRSAGLMITKSDIAELLKIPERNLDKGISQLISDNIINYSDKGISIKNLKRLKAVCNEF
ncbi:Crp/Fnr family transcriptional regulator [Ignavibacteria bacterium CHB1]|nr:MAG: Crp/Fnr family transcriptional regulator [Chlorobiota bacterium]MBV6398967.1 hypothetical protein [Ignavibacteria bacterium]MCC6886195.1 Crp/Fnr family transcriptional regulator [Ignavibacteriales bacterium]MCE7953875.1 Crp/Fnr family transcriptional regulator [Chlorobi bacterium CHB7]MDL1887810.1 Crp/Fnr family transcriptional regulator [Ignavibacteria bacterium CHB1]RIK47893.1 MAG: hypothetical protein DCC60_09350 [Ignavibacteriota bacterium]